MNHRLFLPILIFFLANCGDVGIALNISREQPVDINFKEEIDSVVLEIEGVVDFNIEDVDAFNEYLPRLNELGSIEFNHLAYSLDSLNELETQINIRHFILQVYHENDTLLLVNEADRSLNSRSKEDIPLEEDQIATITQWLFDRKTITTKVNFELTDFPAGLDTVAFKFTSYFDATLKARNIDI